MCKPKTEKIRTQNVACVIPTHNRLNSLKKIIGQLGKQSKSPEYIVIIDDGSSDGTGKYVEELRQNNIKLLHGDGSLWWGGAVHKGINYVLNDPGETDYILLLNDDSLIEDNYIEEMVKDSELFQGAVVVSPQYQTGAHEVGLTGFKVSYKKMKILRTKEKEVDATVGRGLLIPISVSRKIGNVNHRLFPHYMGDVEYTARIKEKGFPLVISEKGKMFTDLNESDGHIRARGIIISMFHSRSKVNVRDRLFFFVTRGPWVYRIFAAPRIMAEVFKVLIKISIKNILGTVRFHK